MPEAHGTATVLIVEDDSITRMIVQRMVEALGATACCVEDGSHALEVSAARRVDLVLLDCNMPGMDGFEVARSLRRATGATPADVPVVALTGDREHATVERCRTAGMDGYLSKPLSLRLLSDTLVRFIAAKDATAPAARRTATAPRVDAPAAAAPAVDAAAVNAQAG